MATKTSTRKRPRVQVIYVPCPPDLARIQPGPGTDRAAAALRAWRKPLDKDDQRATEGGA
jgi:hypothetical protein